MPEDRKARGLFRRYGADQVPPVYKSFFRKTDKENAEPQTELMSPERFNPDRVYPRIVGYARDHNFDFDKKGYSEREHDEFPEKTIMLAQNHLLMKARYYDQAQVQRHFMDLIDQGEYLLITKSSFPHQTGMNITNHFLEDKDQRFYIWLQSVDDKTANVMYFVSRPQMEKLKASQE